MHNQKTMLRPHPFSILTYLYRFLLLLILPLLRGFVSALTGDLVSWLRGAWFDILIVLLIITLASLKWRCIQYYMDKNRLIFTKGIFKREYITIPMDRICTLSILRPFWLRPLQIVKVRFDTIARDAKKADLEMYVSRKEAERLISYRHQPTSIIDGNPAVYVPNFLGLVFLSLFTSNSFLGIVFIATFISQAGQILGRELSDLLLSTFEQISRQVAFGLPPVAAGVAIALLVGWLVAFLYNLLQTKDLCTRRTDDTLHIRAGVFVEKEYSLLTKDISFIDIRQSILTKLFGLYSVFIDAIGLGKDKSDINAIVPFSTYHRIQKQLARLLPEYRLSKRQIKPNAGAIFKFVIDPLWPCVLIPVAAIVAAKLLPNWYMIIRFLGMMLSIPAYWFLGVRLIDFFTSGLSKEGNYYTLRYSNLYYLHTVVFSSDKIAMINIRQSILQRGDNKCDLIVSTRAEGRKRHHLRNLDWNACAALFDAYDPQ